LQGETARMAKRGLKWRMGVALLAAAALGYQAWRSRWLWGMPEAGQGSRVSVAGGSSPEASAAALGASLDRYVARLAAYGYSGSVLVARGGRVLLDKGYGLADRARGRPYTPETLFDVASISKQFTAAAILKLEMEGKLAVEDPLGKFFPAAPPDKAGITLHQLLTHTSGLADTFGEEYEPVTRHELLRRVFASAPLGPPGRRYRYSNGGYSVLAAVVEVASGQSYDSYLRGRLFEPAGMRHTGFRLPPAALALLAHGYGPEGDWGTPLDHPWAADGPYWDLRGNGGILSTTGDLYRWHLALAGDTVLARPQRDKYVTPYVSEGRWAGTDYAYGWSIGKSPTGKREISHIGGNGYFESDFRRYVGDDAVIILSGNSFDYSALALGDHLENRIFGLPDPEPPAVSGLPGVAAASGGEAAAASASSATGATAATTAGLAARCIGTYTLPPPAGPPSARRDERLEVSLDTTPGAPAGRLEVAATGGRGLALLLGALDNEDHERVARHDEQAAEGLAGALAGSWAPFAKLMGLPPEAAATLLKARLAGAGAPLGAWTGCVVLGDAVHGGRWLTYARCTFERGARLLELGWAGPTVETLRLLGALPPQRFLPEAAAGSLAAFDPRSGIIVHAACEPAGGAGPAAALTLRSGGGAATRAARAAPRQASSGGSRPRARPA
jgi:CubicO group peptidase (beta-lactamase class C family)